MWSGLARTSRQKVKAPRGAAVGEETLAEQVSRRKHRWLKRAMYDAALNSSEKCFAYLVVDRLNCVTLDCWPSQKLIADDLGWSTKTVHRVAFGLKRRGYLRIDRNTFGSYRYAPVFMQEDEDKFGRAPRQTCLPGADKNVEESSLAIQLSKSSPSSALQGMDASRYDGRQRGSYEMLLAEKLGQDGFDILGHLSERDDLIVERLCRALAEGQLGERELVAARLAAQQMPRKRRAI